MKMFELIIFAFIQLFFIKAAFCQNSYKQLDSVIKKYVSQLREGGVDTLCIYQDYCVGCDHVWLKDEDKCHYGNLYVPSYIFWISKGQTFMTEKDNCFDYSTIQIKNDSFWQFYFSNRNFIKREKIRVPQVLVIRNGKKYIYSVITDHSQIQHIKIVAGRDTFNKEINDFSFKENIEANEKNLNEHYNNNTRLRKLQLLLEKIIQENSETINLNKIRR